MPASPLTITIVQEVNLAYQDGSSDKVYNIWIEQHDVTRQCNVCFSYGRRGGSLNRGVKNPSPVDYVKAAKIFQQLQNSKTAKGYEIVGTGGAVVMSAAAPVGTLPEHLPQLLNAINEEEVDDYINNPDWIASEKMDGERRIVEKKDGVLYTFNRKGMSIPYPGEFEELIAGSREDFTLDCEIIGKRLHVFDMLADKGVDIRKTGYEKRMHRLMDFYVMHMHLDHIIKPVDISMTKKAKRMLYDRVKAENGEGIVFRLRDSKYTPGRPASGGEALKYKFWVTGSFIIETILDKRSVQLTLLDASGNYVHAGNCAIPVNKSIPMPGAIVEVRYLHAFKSSNVIYQPFYLGERNDIAEEDCTQSQLKYKPEI